MSGSGRIRFRDGWRLVEFGGRIWSLWVLIRSCFVGICIVVFVV